MAKTPKPPATTIEGEGEEVKPAKKRTSPAQFVQQVLAEGRKVTWTSWRETRVSTIMVLIMIVLMAVFFLAVDWVLRTAVAWLLSVNR
ncbi:MAG: preprotein translocase subunit SecE [Parvularculaceae bacterium]|nr:preprotein translocase subunit SecE [Parvularculaceae bacterium]